MVLYEQKCVPPRQEPGCLQNNKHPTVKSQPSIKETRGHHGIRKLYCSSLSGIRTSDQSNTAHTGWAPRWSTAQGKPNSREGSMCWCRGKAKQTIRSHLPSEPAALVVHRVHSIVFAELPEAWIFDVPAPRPLPLPCLVLDHHLLAANKA